MVGVTKRRFYKKGTIMGYRSEVGIKCGENAYKMFEQAIKDGGFNTCFVPDTVYKDSNNHYTLSWEWVKWYDEFDGVQDIEHVMDILDGLADYDNDKGYGYHFIRIGEEYGDIEERYTDYLDFYVIRTIVDGDEIKF